MLLLLISCTQIECGKGTHLEGSTCVADDPPTGSSSPTDSQTDSGTIDSGTDTATDSGTDSGTDTTTDSDTTPPSGWSDHFFAPYVDATAYPTVKIGEIPAENHTWFYTLAFLVAKDPNTCEATWGTYYSLDVGPSAWDNGKEYFLYEQLASLRTQGGDVMVSFGGAANTPIEAACSDDASVVAEYERAISLLQLSHIDFDIEGNWVAHPDSIHRRSRAIAALQKKHPGLSVWYTLPVLPTGLTAEGIAVVQDAVDNGVNLAGVNVMTMDYGDGTAPNPDGQMGAYGIDAITALHDQLAAIYGASRSDAEIWKMVGTTPMIGQNDVGSEYFYISDAQQTLSFAQQKGIGMIGMWSINRDHPCKQEQTWATSDCNGSTTTADWAYSTVFKDF